MPRRCAVTEHGRAPVQVANQVGAWGDKAIAGSDDVRSELVHLGNLSLDVRAVAHIVRLSGTRVPPVSRQLLRLAPSPVPNRWQLARRLSAKVLPASELPDGYIADPSPTD